MMVGMRLPNKREWEVIRELHLNDISGVSVSFHEMGCMERGYHKYRDSTVNMCHVCFYTITLPYE